MNLCDIINNTLRGCTIGNAVNLYGASEVTQEDMVSYHN